MSNSQRTPTLAALPELSRKIIELARSHRRISVAQAAQWTETNRNTIKLHMRNLVEQGRLVKGGAGRGTWYEPLVLTEQSNVVQRTNRSPLITIPLDAITSLSVENAAALVRAVLSAECRYAELSPKALTLSTRVHVPDGGIDAEVETASLKPPTDCLFEQGVTGF